MTVPAFFARAKEGSTDTWLTPKWLLDELGPFNLDPCAAPEPRPFPTAGMMISEANGDGLAAQWLGRVWLNPPYSNPGPWVEKLEQHGNGIALVFARTDTEWFQPFLRRNGVWFMKGRINFLRPDGSLSKSGSASAPSVLIPFGRQNLAAILSSCLEGVWKA